MSWEPGERGVDVPLPSEELPWDTMQLCGCRLPQSPSSSVSLSLSDPGAPLLPAVSKDKDQIWREQERSCAQAGPSPPLSPWFR